MLTATILSSAALPLPSASGIELVGATAYVISDDSPFLYRFRATDLTPHEPIRLFEPEKIVEGRIPKKRKPDLEAIALLPADAAGGAGLLIAGSGSKKRRDGGFWVALDPDGATGAVQPLDLEALYDVLRDHLPADQKLNLEALAATDTELLLFQRSVGTAAGRVCFRLPLPAVRALLHTEAPPIPAFQGMPYNVPDLDGQPGGLSGACVFEGRLFVTASVEISDDPVRDGEVLGSFVGLLDLRQPADGHFAHLAWPDGRPFREKVEGVAVRQKTATGYELLLVTDDDKGGSTVLVVAVREA